MSNCFSDWTEADVLKHNARIKMQTTKPVKQRSKYGNEKVEVNGIKYDSKKEAKRAEELEYMQKWGEIKNLERQKKYVLQPSFEFNGNKIREIAYLADFVYEQNGESIVEDVKSEATRKDKVYKLKKKMMMYVHKIEIKEV